MPSTLGMLPESLRTCFTSNKKSKVVALRNPCHPPKKLRKIKGRARVLKVRGKAQLRVAKSRKKRERVPQTKIPSKLTPLWIGRVGAESKRR